jgi:cellulose synthase/poly-beta-1,6-N-acetylglucosamine synthase-like glycosyltransferase
VPFRPALSAEPAADVPVSVAMAAYNGIRYLDIQLRSIVRTLGPADELVVVDDGSTDGTWERLREAAAEDPRIRVHRNDGNAGVRATFERALRLVRHELVFLSDQDDVWEAGKRDAVVRAFLDDPQCVLVVTDAVVVDGDDRVLLPSFMASRGGFAGGFLDTLYCNRYLGCAMAVRRRLLDAALPIPRLAPMHDMWLGAIAPRIGRVRYLPSRLLRYRRHDANATPLKHRTIVPMVVARLRLLLAWLIRVARLALSGAQSRGR